MTVGFFEQGVPRTGRGFRMVSVIILMFCEGGGLETSYPLRRLNVPRYYAAASSSGYDPYVAADLPPAPPGEAQHGVSGFSKSTTPVVNPESYA